MRENEKKGQGKSLSKFIKPLWQKATLLYFAYISEINLGWK